MRSSLAACEEARFQDGEEQQSGGSESIAPDLLICGPEEEPYAVAYHFASGQEYSDSRRGFSEPGVLSAYVVDGPNWLITTDDRTAAQRLAQALDGSVIERDDYTTEG